jgi:hypothetical protein
MNYALENIDDGTVHLSKALRLFVYVGSNVAVIVLLGSAIALFSEVNARLVYVVLLWAMCSSPILWLDRLNGAYFLLIVYTMVYFVFFGLGDGMSMLLGEAASAEQGVLTPAEAVILASLLGLIAAYRLMASSTRPASSASGTRDWSFAAMLRVGALFWLVGTASLAYWQIYIVNDRTNVSLIKNLNSLGPGLTTLFMLGQLVQPLGILILAYAYAAYRRNYLLPLIIAVVLFQVILGFVADFKGEAMSAGIVVIITKGYVDGKVPKAWLAGAALFIVFVFPVFQAYRTDVRGAHGVTSVQAAQNLVSTFQKSVDAATRIKSGYGGAEYRAQSFWQRSSLKPSVDLIVTKTGEGAPFQWGATLAPLAAAFVPKILWPDKPSIAVGQVFNNTFHIGEVADTYISPSHVGEVYWNFGWLGTVLLMPVIGILLGAIGARFSAYPFLSLTGLMVTLVTVRLLVINSESSIASEYVVWLRSMGAIFLLHLVFAKVGIVPDVRRGKAAQRSAISAHGNRAIARFPHLMR